MESRFQLAPRAPTIIQDKVYGKSYVFHSVKEAEHILRLFRQYENIHRASIRKIAQLERRVMELQDKLSTYIRIEDELDIMERQLENCREELEEYED